MACRFAQCAICRIGRIEDLQKSRFHMLEPGRSGGPINADDAFDKANADSWSTTYVLG